MRQLLQVHRSLSLHRRSLKSAPLDVISHFTCTYLYVLLTRVILLILALHAGLLLCFKGNIRFSVFLLPPWLSSFSVFFFFVSVGTWTNGIGTYIEHWGTKAVDEETWSRVRFVLKTYVPVGWSVDGGGGAFLCSSRFLYHPHPQWVMGWPNAAVNVVGG